MVRGVCREAHALPDLQPQRGVGRPAMVRRSVQHPGVQGQTEVPALLLVLASLQVHLRGCRPHPRADLQAAGRHVGLVPEVHGLGRHQREWLRLSQAGRLLRQQPPALLAPRQQEQAEREVLQRPQGLEHGPVPHARGERPVQDRRLRRLRQEQRPELGGHREQPRVSAKGLLRRRRLWRPPRGQALHGPACVQVEQGVHRGSPRDAALPQGAQGAPGGLRQARPRARVRGEREQAAGLREGHRRLFHPPPPGRQPAGAVS
mmetsp:Transcript_86592/g.269125  ORF Transcript_86592/g.269125 Transcript_86592/m.269125 type:complete len:261 (-) Transcript_86592:284-1066(-)